MKFIATLILLILSSIWYITSYKSLVINLGDNMTNNISYSILLYLAGMFVLGVLFGKTLIKNRTEKEKKEYEEFLEYKNKKFSEELFEQNKKIDYSKEIFEAEKEKEEINKTFHNYEEDYEPTKKGIDEILEEKKDILKHKINLKKETITQNLNLKKNNFILKNKIIKPQFKIKNTETIIKKPGEIEDTMFKNVAQNLKKQKKQDLKIIEGIGPKLEEILNKSGIYSYKDLAESKISKLNLILQSAGKRYVKLHNPITWSKQAKYAQEGKIEELKKYQGKLVKGIEVKK